MGRIASISAEGYDLAMVKNEVYELEITGMTGEGAGVGRADGIVVFVDGAIVGERVSAKIIKVKSSYAIGKLLEVIHPSKERVCPDCDKFSRCGGCALRHISYAEQLRFKEGRVADGLKRIAGLECEVMPIVGMAKPDRYRSKAIFPVGADGIGVYALHSHRIISTTDCLLNSQDTMAAVALVREYMAETGVRPYDEATHSGEIRHIMVRGTEELMVCVVTRTANLPEPKALISKLRELPNVVSIMQNINRERTNVALSNENRLLWGRERIIQKIGEIPFEVSVNSFFQVNSRQTEVLYERVKTLAALTGTETLLDLYCGAGTIGLYLAKLAGRVIGVEIVPQAVEDANRNALLCGVKNVEFHVGAAEELLPKLQVSPDLVILDPPRKGCDEKLIAFLLELLPERIIYVSCEISTLARDLAVLSAKYHIGALHPVDMFPHTPHVECVVLLQKANT